jgi:sugar phosphate isomerase/epimerase
MKNINRRNFISSGIFSTLSLFLTNLAVSVETKTKVNYQIGCFTRPFDNWELDRALDGIAAAGFKYCGIMTAKGKSWVVITPETKIDEALKIGELAQSRGLKISCVYGDFASMPPVDEWNLYLRQLIDCTQACQAPYLMLGGIGDKNSFNPYYNTVRNCCDYAQSKNIHLTLKPHGGTNATGNDLRKIINYVNHENFKVWYDPANIFYYSDGQINPIDDIVSCKGLIVGMSIKDYTHPKNVNVTPGNGLVGYPKLFKTMIELGFSSGPLIVECLAKGDYESVVNEAKKTREFLNNLIANL